MKEKERLRGVEKRLMSFLEEFEIKFNSKSKQEFAKIDIEDKIVEINLPLVVVQPLIHEFLHYEYPELSEREIEELSFKILKKIRRKIIHFIFNYLIALYFQ